MNAFVLNPWFEYVMQIMFQSEWRGIKYWSYAGFVIVKSRQKDMGNWCYNLVWHLLVRRMQYTSWMHWVIHKWPSTNPNFVEPNTWPSDGAVEKMGDMIECMLGLWSKSVMDPDLENQVHLGRDFYRDYNAQLQRITTLRLKYSDATWTENPPRELCDDIEDAIEKAKP